MKNIFLILLTTTSLCSFAQQKIKTVEVSDTIIYATVDRPGDFYVVTKQGQIQKFDKDGKLVIVYKHKGAPTLFDPRDGARLFAYYRDHQQYDYYNPSFETTSSYHIDSAFAIQPWLICPSGDHKLWVLDKVDNSLKKLNAKHTEVEIEVLIDTAIIEKATIFKTIRDYQNFVFLLDQHKGIHIFNGIGKHIRTIPEKNISYFNFLGEEMYYLKNGMIVFTDLFSAESRSIPAPAKAKFVLLTDERMFVVTATSFDVFPFKP
jgi:hypothetical protein